MHLAIWEHHTCAGHGGPMYLPTSSLASPRPLERKGVPGQLGTQEQVALSTRNQERLDRA